MNGIVANLWTRDSEGKIKPVALPKLAGVKALIALVASTEGLSCAIQRDGLPNEDKLRDAIAKAGMRSSTSASRQSIVFGKRETIAWDL